LDWLLFAKSATTLVPFTETFISLDGVFIQNAKTLGFLSVRSNEGWTAPGKVWTRGTEESPAGAFSWERFQIQLVGAPTKHLLQKENEQLRVQLNAAQLEIQTLRAERVQLEEYRAFFQQFQKLNSMTK